MCWHTDRMSRMVSVGIGLVAVGLVAVEVATWRSSRAALLSERRDPHLFVPGKAVIVLGCPLPALQRWRTRIAVRSTDPSTARLVFTGAATRGDVSEAKTMANYAVGSLGVSEHAVVLEESARNTVENIDFSLPLITRAPAIKIASNAFHALRARQIIAENHPDAVDRLARGRDYLPFEWGWLHPALFVFEQVRRVRA